MPIYEYQCESCGHRCEVLQRISDEPLAECPQCGGPTRKLISAPAFQFKGSGWYVTDYAKKGGGEAKGEKGDGKAEAGAKAASADKGDGDKGSGAKDGGKEKSGGEAASTAKSPPSAG